MELNLRVVNRQGRTAERDVSLSLSQGVGVTLGRGPARDLCLEDPERVVSGNHGRIDLRDGGVWFTDTSRNGTYLNNAVDPMPSHQAVALYDGDRLTIGPYDVLVVLGTGAEPAAAGSDPFSGMGDGDLPGLAKAGAATDILDLLDPGGSQGAGGGTPLAEPKLTGDPFADASPLDDHLAGPAAQAPAQDAPHRHTPVEHVFYRPAEHHPVPDDYDLLNDAWANPVEDSDAPPSSDAPESPPMAEPVEPAFDQPSPGASEPAGAVTERMELPLPPPEDAPPPRRPEPPRPRPARAGGELESFLAGLGVGKLSEVEQPEVLLRHAGELLRSLAAGLTQTMMVRAQFKSELRLGVTSIRAAENNPFKFSVDTDDILERLLFRPSPGFLPAEPAAREAFDDIQAHEMAMTAGLQAALRALLARFEPVELERRLSRRSGLDQILPMARKARYWDLFTETYEQVAADASEDFMKLFDDAFARAYREQIQRLAEARGSRRRS